MGQQPSTSHSTSRKWSTLDEQLILISQRAPQKDIRPHKRYQALRQVSNGDEHKITIFTPPPLFLFLSTILLLFLYFSPSKPP